MKFRVKLLNIVFSKICQYIHFHYFFINTSITLSLELCVASLELFGNEKNHIVFETLLGLFLWIGQEGTSGLKSNNGLQ